MDNNMANNDTKIINHSITRLLARREHCQTEIVNKLRAKGFDEKLVKQQLQLFVDKNIQSDARYVESYIRSKANSGQGKQRILMALQTQDIDENVINQGFEQAETDFYDNAVKVYQKKYTDKPIVDWQDKQKRMRFMQYRGFSTQQIDFVFKNGQGE
ncbi:regulatory protein RecX [Aliiglaciecola sp. LCG003]|uniref:regulatory protein RecX n=1 Tax=Aliiglaciecola sp. LCG003 TaxID=3053655 RepID=UPI0025744EEB|nr:regulatory protein RecX [Aliiglaciecola sp. LCG003]WJG08381.1 regulatory protein RecX [Aliiglaciecola sp. LCG003]